MTIDITVFGRGCSRCESTVQRIEREAAEMGASVKVHKITDDVEIVQNGVMTTPAVKIDGKIVHAGGIPSIETVHAWLEKTQ